MAPGLTDHRRLTHIKLTSRAIVTDSSVPRESVPAIDSTLKIKCDCVPATCSQHFMRLSGNISEQLSCINTTSCGTGDLSRPGNRDQFLSGDNCEDMSATDFPNLSSVNCVSNLERDSSSTCSTTGTSTYNSLITTQSLSDKHNASHDGCLISTTSLLTKDVVPDNIMAPPCSVVSRSPLPSSTVAPPISTALTVTSVTCTATGTEDSTHGYATAVNQLPLPVSSDQGSTSAYSDSSTTNMNTTSPKLPSISSLLSASAAVPRRTTSTESRESMIDSLHTRARRRQHDLQRRAQRAHRRLLRLQARQAQAHVSGQLRSFVDYQHHTLQTMAASLDGKEAPSSSGLLLQCNNMKNMSTASLVKLVQRVQMHHQTDSNAMLRQRIASNTAMSSSDSVLKLDSESCTEMERVCTTLTGCLHHAECAIDSDATESDSGGDSSTEIDYDNTEETLTKPPIDKRAEWSWACNRAHIASQWTWLQAQVSDLEYRIRQQTDIYRQIRNSKGDIELLPPVTSHMAPVVDGNTTTAHTPPARNLQKRLSPLAEKIAEIERKNELTPTSISAMLNPVPDPAVNTNGNSVPSYVINPSSYCNSDNKMLTSGTRSGLNGYTPPLPVHEPTSSTIEDDATCVAARCRPIKTCHKRKLLYTAGIHQRNRKAARLSSVCCHCHPPALSCALCSGRHNHTKTVDPCSMSFQERMSLLSPTYHPVLSVPQDVPVQIQFESLLRKGECQAKVNHKHSMKIEKRKSPKRTIHLPNEDKTLKKFNKRKHGLLTNKIKNKYCDSVKTRGGSLPSTPKNKISARKCQSEYKKVRKDMIGPRKNHKLSLGTHTPRDKSSRFKNGTSKYTSELSRSCPSSLFKEMKQKQRETAFDIDNIVIPHSFSSATRVEKLKYKEIVTPKWRVVGNNHVTSVPRKKPGMTTRDDTDADMDTDVATDCVDSIHDPMINDLVDENYGMIKVIIDGEEEMIEDLSLDLISERHLRCEIQERKRFAAALNINRRGRAQGRADSNSVSSDQVDDPDVLPSTIHHVSSSSSLTGLKESPTPSVSNHSLSLSEDFIVVGSNATGTLAQNASLTAEDRIRRRTMSCSAAAQDFTFLGSDSIPPPAQPPPLQPARRPSTTVARARSRSGSVTSEEQYNSSPGWPSRRFPLTDVQYKGMVEEQTRSTTSHSASRSRRRLVSATDTRHLNSGTSQAFLPDIDLTVPSGGGDRDSVSPISSTVSLTYQDDVNDPEWTVQSGGEEGAMNSGLVLKLSKR